MRILIVEDDVFALEVLEMALTSFGHQVEKAVDGLEAWELYDRQPYPIIVSDWNMPELDGLGLCQKVRNRKSQSYTYFIMLTSNVGLENHLKAIDAGVDDFLNKPLKTEEMGIRLKVAERILNFRAEVDAIKEIVPFCSYCKKVRRDEDFWERVETFVEKNMDKDISHSICPACYIKEVEPQFKD